MTDAPVYSGIDPAQFKGHPVDLEVFSGPLDLLLHLVQRERIEIWEISISRITEQYLAHLRSLEALNVEIAGEFLVMAASLMRIKSQMLLPRPVLPLEDTDGMPVTREGLIQKLLEYRRYREAASSLRALEDARARSLPRGFTPNLPSDHMYPLREARVTDLAAYLREVVRRERSAPTHEVQLEEIRLEDQIAHIVLTLAECDRPVRFTDLLRRPHIRLEWIVTFLAMLELARQKSVTVLQEIPFGEIWIASGGPPEPDLVDEPEEGTETSLRELAPAELAPAAESPSADRGPGDVGAGSMGTIEAVGTIDTIDTTDTIEAIDVADVSSAPVPDHGNVGGVQTTSELRNDSDEMERCGDDDGEEPREGVS
jgi:segregation and condensation protein A